MFDRETWLFINSFAPWLAALGTVAAVIVSLYLARRALRLDIRVFAQIVATFGMEPSEEFFKIGVVNHGRKAVVSQIVWWSLGFGRRKQFWIVPPPKNLLSTELQSLLSTGLPCELDFGKNADFFFPTATFNETGRPLLEHVRDSVFPQLTVRLLRVGVVASTNQHFRIPLDAYLRKFILERSRQIKQT